jgi:uncharacterized protein (DUF4415 family)
MAQGSTRVIDLGAQASTYFKATGAGWQTRMNDALVEWVDMRATN